MKLLIIESPNKAREIRHFLDSDWEIEATMGHIRRLPLRSLGVDVKHGFAPTYEVPPDRAETVAILRSAASAAESIVIATDPDREGEAIAFHVFEILEPADQAKCQRAVYREITKKAVLNALGSPRKIDMDMVRAQQARQVLDRLVGYKVSPQLCEDVAKKTSAGRVQSVALRIICDRQSEINAFKPEDFWQVEALLGCKQGEFWARVVTTEAGDDEDGKNRFREEKLATDTLKAIKSSTFKMRKVERKSKKQGAYPPFDTAGLQVTANAILDWGSEKTMAAAQSLFETGKITYHRTDSFTLSDEAITMVRPWISAQFGEKYLPATKNVYKQKSTAATQEAHEAIRPTDVGDSGDDLKADEQELYALIRNRFVASQMADQILDTVVYHVKASSGHDLVAKGQSVSFDGWKRVWNYGKTEELVLPAAETGEALDLKDTKSTKSSTKPPKRYNEGTLIKDLKENGVGRPATWATLITTLRDRGYVDSDGKALVPTELGQKVCDYLKLHYQDFFMNIEFTAEVLEEIDEIAAGKKKFVDVVQAFYDVLASKLGDRILDDEATGKKCPVCEVGEIMIRHGKFGNYYACGNYPECKAILVEKDGKFVKRAEPKQTGHKCSVCQVGDIVKRAGRFGDFYSCNRFPSCKSSYRVGLAGGYTLKT